MLLEHTKAHTVEAAGVRDEPERELGIICQQLSAASDGGHDNDGTFLCHVSILTHLNLMSAKNHLSLDVLHASHHDALRNICLSQQFTDLEHLRVVLCDHRNILGTYSATNILEQQGDDVADFRYSRIGCRASPRRDWMYALTWDASSMLKYDGELASRSLVPEIAWNTTGNRGDTS